MLYRQGLAALDNYCRAAFSGNSFATLSVEQKDKVLVDLERDLIQLDGVNGSAFFKQVLTNTREGFFADPLYGGNHDMAGWKMIGFPGARYDYRDWVERHNQRYPLPPVNIMVIVGLGWTGSILAHELASAGLNVVALERGRWRSTPTGFPTT